MRQLIKFCLVGATSTVIDKSIYWLLLKSLPPTFPWWLSQTIAFCFGVTNGFVWNRLWTFRAREAGSSKEQYLKFVASNIIGLLLNLGIQKVLLIFATGQVVHAKNPDDRTLLIVSLCAIPIVVIWNFSASRFWTFRAPKAPTIPQEPSAPIASPRD